ncbi:MAG: hypothetical protein KDE20_17970, partial [Caldilineaceae bacterium]|nr:hypothetical protein [Caldilineaceae bacterium]
SISIWNKVSATTNCRWRRSLANPGGNGPAVSTSGTSAEFPPWHLRRNDLARRIDRNRRGRTVFAGVSVQQKDSRMQ